MLAATSTYFRQILTKNETTILDISDIEFQLIEAIVNYMYTGTISLTDENHLDLLITSSKWKIHSLQDLIMDYIKQNINVNNVVKCLETATISEYDELYDFCEIYIRKHYDELWYMLHDLSPRSLKQILQSDQINVSI